MGGDPGDPAVARRLQAVATWLPPQDRCEVFTGKVCSVIYDRFGDFCGFVLDTEDGTRRFAAREPEIERVVDRAWAERILTSVFVEKHAPDIVPRRSCCTARRDRCSTEQRRRAFACMPASP